MATCIAKLKSGSRKGEVCGCKSKLNNGYCGRHKSEMASNEVLIPSTPVKKPQNKVKLSPVVDNSKCRAILESGERKGEICGCNSKLKTGFCGRHKRQMQEAIEGPTVILVKPKCDYRHPEGQKCEYTAKKDGRCGYHPKVSCKATTAKGTQCLRGPADGCEGYCTSHHTKILAERQKKLPKVVPKIKYMESTFGWIPLTHMIAMVMLIMWCGIHEKLPPLLIEQSTLMIE